MPNNNENSLSVLSFEDAFAELEKIVLKLEEGDVDLENLVAEYQKGSELLKFCKSKVEKAEIKIKEIEGRTNIIEGDDHVL